MKKMFLALLAVVFFSSLCFAAPKPAEPLKKLVTPIKKAAIKQAVVAKRAALVKKTPPKLVTPIKKVAPKQVVVVKPLAQVDQVAPAQAALADQAAPKLAEPPASEETKKEAE
jgi:hypothetical protein